MILTVTLNTALDRTLIVPNVSLGSQQRSTGSLALPGGKGLNVARALKRLGEPVIATGLTGGRTGTVITEQLMGEGILNDFVRIEAESRTSIALVDPTTMQQTEISEYGPPVTDAELDVMFDKLRYLAKGVSLVVLAGSLPASVPVDIYARITRELRKAGRPVVIDATGEPLRHAIGAEPELVSPNTREAEEVVGYEFSDDDDVAAGAESIAKMGARSVLIHTPDGCLARLQDAQGHVTIARARIDAPADVVSTIGSGDSFLAGFLSKWDPGGPWEPAIRRGVACGMANAMTIGAGVFDPSDVEAFTRLVEMTEL